MLISRKLPRMKPFPTAKQPHRSVSSPPFTFLIHTGSKGDTPGKVKEGYIDSEFPKWVVSVR